jgi:hypothetical protein
MLKQKYNPWPMMAKQTSCADEKITGKYNLGDEVCKVIITGVPL